MSNAISLKYMEISKLFYQSIKSIDKAQY